MYSEIWGWQQLCSSECSGTYLYILIMCRTRATSPRRVFSILPFTSLAKSASSSTSKWAVIIGVLNEEQKNFPWFISYVLLLAIINHPRVALTVLLDQDWQPESICLHRLWSIKQASQPPHRRWNHLQLRASHTWCSSKRWLSLWCAEPPEWCSWRLRQQSGRFSRSSECLAHQCSEHKEPRQRSPAPSELWVEDTKPRP